MKKGYMLDGIHYNTKKQVVNKCRSILDSGFVPEDAETFLLDIFQMHHRYKDIILSEYPVEVFVDHCYVNPKNNSFYLSVEGIHDTMDISYMKALSQYSVDTLAKKALRNEISMDMIEFKEDYFDNQSDKHGKVRCQSTGKLMSKEESHLDHYPVTFDRIATDFVGMVELPLKDIEIETMAFNLSRLADRNLANRFREYHNERVNYRVVLAKVNLTRKRKEII